MKALTALGIVLAAIGLSAPASAQTLLLTAHDETASVLQCLLNHGMGCEHKFVSGASQASAFWRFHTSVEDFDLGDVMSSEYAGTEPQNAYTSRFLSGRTADVYDVKFARKELTFYIVPPGPDGKVRYMMIRNGAPRDEAVDFWARRP